MVLAAASVQVQSMKAVGCRLYLSDGERSSKQELVVYVHVVACRVLFSKPMYVLQLRMFSKICFEGVVLVSPALLYHCL